MKSKVLSPLANINQVTVPAILKSKGLDKITAITAYDYVTALLVDKAKIDCVLVGDSLSSVIQGHNNTLSVTLDEIIYHSKCVRRGLKRALLIADMPFMSYQASSLKALENAGRLVKEGEVSAIKLEGGVHVAKTIRRITRIDIPVMAHVGLTPQSYHRMGGHKIQGKVSGDINTPGSRERIIEDALAVEDAGAFSVVLEGIPSDLAAEITPKLKIPTIGIASGKECDGQILVFHDLLGLNPEGPPSFLKDGATLHVEIGKILKKYTESIR